MRSLIVMALAGLMLASASASATPDVSPPTVAPPAATAPVAQRQAWCEQYVAWFVTNTPHPAPLPPDVRPTHLFEIEFNSCKLDPQTYERETHAQAAMIGRLPRRSDG